MSVTAKGRSSLALNASTSLDVDDLKNLIKTTAGQVKGGGASLLTTGIANLGAGVHVEKESANELALSITSGKRIVELCTFRARISTDGARSTVTVGGLDTYKTSQATVLGFIPSGPKMIQGMAPYKKFLEVLAAQLQQADPAASVTIAQPA